MADSPASDAQGSGKFFRNNAPLMTRIKKMMQADDDVGKVAKASPVLIAKALDIFLHSLTQQAVGVAESRGAKTLTGSHLKAEIEKDPLFDFCKSIVEGVPDLPPEKPKAELASGTSPKAKRGHTAKGESTGKAAKKPRAPRKTKVKKEEASATEEGAKVRSGKAEDGVGGVETKGEPETKPEPEDERAPEHSLEDEPAPEASFEGERKPEPADDGEVEAEPPERLPPTTSGLDADESPMCGPPGEGAPTMDSAEGVPDEVPAPSAGAAEPAELPAPESGTVPVETVDESGVGPLATLVAPPVPDAEDDDYDDM